MTRHTPGPWHKSATHLGKAYDVGAANGANVALVPGPEENGGDEFEKNATWIAAIPDLSAALYERDMFLNPDALEEAADEIDCCSGCDHVWHESDTNASGCYASERGEYCPNDVAETLRALARVARKIGTDD